MCVYLYINDNPYMARIVEEYHQSRKFLLTLAYIVTQEFIRTQCFTTYIVANDITYTSLEVVANTFLIAIQ